VRETLSGSIDAPLRCSDAGKGCWVTDAGQAAGYVPGSADLIAISFLEATMPWWNHSVHQSGNPSKVEPTEGDRIV
jgi:hypothetical protein